MITHNGKQVTLAMRNRKAINLIARNGKAMFGEYGDIAYTAIDAAAKAVILAEYGSVVWSDVRDYAKAHPQIVEFINQDPHLACSLSTNSNKERWLVGDGKAYIKTGLYPKSNTRVKSRFCLFKENNQYPWAFGSENPSRTNRLGVWLNSTTLAPRAGTANPNITRSNINNPIVAEFNGNIIVNGENKGSYTLQDIDYEMYLFAVNLLNSHKEDGAPMAGGIDYFEMDDHTFVPHQRPDGQCGMLDLVTYTFHPNANTQGTFTIAVTDKA